MTQPNMLKWLRHTAGRCDAFYALTRRFGEGITDPRKLPKCKCGLDKWLQDQGLWDDWLTYWEGYITNFEIS